MLLRNNLYQRGEMANPMVFDDIYEVTVCSRAGGQNGLNVRHCHVTAVSSTPMTDLMFANRLRSTLADELPELLSVQAEFMGVIVKKIWPQLGQPIKSEGGPIEGDVLGDMMAPQTAGLIRFTTATGGPQGRGRMYVPFAAESDSINEGRPHASYVTRLDALGLLFVGSQTYTTVDLESATVEWVLWERATASFRVVTGRRARSEWATQRRRNYLGKGDANPFG
jgi:hypothetical protein